MPGPLRNQGYVPGPRLLRATDLKFNDPIFPVSYQTGYEIQLTRSKRTAYGTARSFRTEPARYTIGPPPTPKLKVYLAAPQPRHRRPGRAQLRPPTVVLPDIPLAGDGKRTLRIRLARAIPLAARFTRSRIAPPAVVNPPAAGPLAPPLQVHLAQPRPRSLQAGRARIFPPTVLAPLPVDAKLRVYLARLVPATARFTRSRISPPVIPAAASAEPVSTKLRIYFAQNIPRQARRAMFFLNPPTALNAPAGVPPVETKLRVYLARLVPAAARFTRSRIAPPAVVNPPAAPAAPVETRLRIYLARNLPVGSDPRYAPGSSIAGPAVSAPLPVETTLKVYRAGGRETILRRAGKSFQTRPPIVTPAPGPLFESKLKVYRAGGRETLLRRPGRSNLRPPTVVNAPISNPPLVTKLRIYLSPVNEYEFIRRHAPAAFNLGPAPIVPAVSEASVRHPHMISTHG